MYKTPVTIEETLNQIKHNKIVLPAIQREFVWKPEQICKLFDSLMQGYPFGTFLYWTVKQEHNKNYQFYGFICEYHERDNPHCPRLGEMPNQDVIAVLDGQQRLTALNIGLCGSMAKKLPRKRWSNPDAFPAQNLCLDLKWDPDEEDDIGIRYRFDFLTPQNLKAKNDSAAGKEYWFQVKDILTLADSGPAMQEWLENKLPGQPVSREYKVLYTLYEMIRKERLVCYYEEVSQELEKVLQIFIRTNSGGTVLTYSDLLLSVAVAQWPKLDARKEIHQTVDDINGIGNEFDFSKDWVLKAGLMLSDIRNVGFKVENFNRHNMMTLEHQWHDIKRTLTRTVKLVSSFGFNWETLRADSALLPIAYYLHARKAGDDYLEHTKFAKDREIIRHWLISSFLKPGIWGSGLDSLLTTLRQTIKDNPADGFPSDLIGEAMRRRGKSLAFDKEEIDDLTDLKYGDKLSFSLLSLVFKHLDMSNYFHVDHFFPKSCFTKNYLKKQGFEEDEIMELKQMADSLPNLQLLSGPKNQEKSSTLPAEWLERNFNSEEERKEYVNLHLLGNVPNDLLGFKAFHKARRERLRDKIREMLM